MATFAEMNAVWEPWVAPGATPEDVQKVTEPALLRAPGLKTISV